MGYRIFDTDPLLRPYAQDIILRIEQGEKKKEELVSCGTLCDFANGHEYFGFHKVKGGWYYREWAPAATEVYLIGDFTEWRYFDYKLTALSGGVHEIFIEGEDTLYDGCRVKTVIRHNGTLYERIPLYIRRVEQDVQTGAWCGVICDTPEYKWKNKSPKPAKEGLFIYECHIGMAQEREGVGTYAEFTDEILPRIKRAGYNTIQIMAIMEHPYYGSFGYQVSSFFAASSRFGGQNELKRLVDTAHGMGISVLLDVVHSHAVRNTNEGINEFDGTSYQFFHEGERGEHPAWGTKLFNYGKNEVLHFLLSNLKFWMTEYRFDGFRFDGVTSMIYHDHGLGVAFTDYSKYFSMNTDIEALTYLRLANELVREINPNAITIAEDMSAFPGMCLPICDGGVGFDYRLAMGTPDLWIGLLRECPDEYWDMWRIWGELSSRREGEKYIAYAESHDQALVGDKTIMFRLCDSNMYTHMAKGDCDAVVERGVALHKMIRMITMTAGGEGYLNFMGNEFGHPEWIDFPREGNGWSHFYCRRQWHLADDENLKYTYLSEFDRALVSLARSSRLLCEKEKSLYIDNEAKVLVYERGEYTFAFNFSPTQSYPSYPMRVSRKGKYRVELSSDESIFGGYDRISKEYVYSAVVGDDGVPFFEIYLPARTALCVRRTRTTRSKKAEKKEK